MERIGLFGGSFDPVHFGHLLVAQAALEEVPLDWIWLIPAAQSPLKTDRPLAPAPCRLRMLRQALEGRCRCGVDAQEIRRGGVSYSVDTVRDYRQRFPQAKLYYLIGADQLGPLPKWKDAGALAEMVEFLIIPRPGQPAAAAPAAFKSRELRGIPFAVSASEIRRRVRDNRPIDWLTPRPVAETIRNNDLYRRAAMTTEPD